MGREIKFRIWDNLNKKYFRFDLSGRIIPLNANSYLDGKNYPNLKFEIRTNDHEECPDFKYNNHFDYIFQQCTGVCDKNGEEIYEGDIVKSFVNYLGEECENGIVEYCIEKNSIYLGSFMFRNCDNDRGGLSYFEPPDGPEIVGNIFENPELCSKK